MRLIILIILIILIVGAVPSWPYSTGWGYYPVGGLGTLLIILLILALICLARRIRLHSTCPNKMDPAAICGGVILLSAYGLEAISSPLPSPDDAGQKAKPKSEGERRQRALLNCIFERLAKRRGLGLRPIGDHPESIGGVIHH
jgi:hypothetical protein